MTVLYLCLAYISRLTPKCLMICRLTPKSCVMYAGLRLAQTFVCCCPDQLNKRLTDSKNESVRRKSCSVRAKSTFVVASSQSQRVASALNISTGPLALHTFQTAGPVRASTLYLSLALQDHRVKCRASRLKITVARSMTNFATFSCILFLKFVMYVLLDFCRYIFT